MKLQNIKLYEDIEIYPYLNYKSPQGNVREIEKGLFF